MMEPLPERLDRIDDITRRYARYSRHQTGLGAIWAGVCLLILGLAVVAFEIHRYASRPTEESGLEFWRFLVSRPDQFGPLWLMVLALSIPPLWFWGNRWIQQSVYERAGKVLAPPVPADATALEISRVLSVLVPGILVALVWLRFTATGSLGSQVAGASLATAIALPYPLFIRRLTSVLDRSALTLLVVGCCTLAYGGAAESRLFCMTSYALLGVGAIASGWTAHRNFRQVMRELTGLK